MNRCTVIDRLQDEYGIKPENLTEREKAIIGLCTNEFLENEEQELSLASVVEPKGKLVCECEEPSWWPNMVGNLTCTKCNKPNKEN